MKTGADGQSGIVETLGIGRAGGRRKKWKWIVGGVVLLLVGAGILSFAKKEEVDPEKYFRTEAAKKGALTVTVSATGSLEPTNQVDVGSEQSGIVESVEVTYNDRVAVGQVLARLDPSKLDAQVMQSRASLESARAQLLQSEAAVTEAQNRMNRLADVWERSGNKVPSREDLEVAQTTLRKAQAAQAAAEAQVSVAEANLEAFETDFKKLIIYSPVNGIVLSRDVEPGQTIQASFQAVTLFRLAEDLTHMELHVAVDEADVGQVREGQKATFTVDAYPDRTFDAEVMQVRYGAKTEQGVVTYETVLSADNSELLLRPGMTATAEIVVNEISEALLIPNAALRFLPSEKDLARFSKQPKPDADAGKKDMAGPTTRAEQKVWSIAGENLAAREIIVGETDMDHTEVKSGELKPGDPVITGLQTVGAKP